MVSWGHSDWIIKVDLIPDLESQASNQSQKLLDGPLTLRSDDDRMMERMIELRMRMGSDRRFQYNDRYPYRSKSRTVVRKP